MRILFTPISLPQIALIRKRYVQPIPAIPNEFHMKVLVSAWGREQLITSPPLGNQVARVSRV